MFAKPEATIGADVASCIIDVRAIIADVVIAVNLDGTVPSTPPRAPSTADTAEKPADIVEAPA